jgi:hypothetical protein
MRVFYTGAGGGESRQLHRPVPRGSKRCAGGGVRCAFISQQRKPVTIRTGTSCMRHAGGTARISRGSISGAEAVVEAVAVATAGLRF